MLQLLLLLTLGYSNVGTPPSPSTHFCTEIFDRGIRDLDLEFIHQTRDESPAALRDVLKNVPAFRSFSKDEINELVTLFRSNEIKDKDTDVILKELTDNLVATRSYLQKRIQERKQQEEEKPTSEFETALFSASGSKPQAPKVEVVENYVTVGDFALAFRGPSLHRYMLLKPWESHQMNALVRTLAERHITVVEVKEGKGILALIHPKDLGVLPRLVETLKTVEPFKEDPSSF